jgi:hypothetical protein
MPDTQSSADVIVVGARWSTPPTDVEPALRSTLERILYTEP